MKKQLLIVFSLIITICVFGVSRRVYAQSDSILALANRYSLALKKLEKQKRRGNIAEAYGKGQAVADKLDELENLNAANYASIEKKMKGFVINRNEIVFVKPDVVFFKKLSRRRGTKADIAFFTLLGELRPESVWLAYIEQQTDYSGCTIYGRGIMTKLYGKTKQFRRQYPSSYVDNIKEELRNLKSEFTENTCACGDSSGVTREFQLFIKIFPRDEITPIVKKRLAEIQNKKTTIRFKCLSG